VLRITTRIPSPRRLYVNSKNSYFVKKQVDVLLVKLASLSPLHFLTSVSGLSSSELWTQRKQFTHEPLPLSDSQFIPAKHDLRSSNHSFSERPKNPRALVPNSPSLQIGDLVYLISDKDKSRARDRFIVASTDPPW